jgi:hypothetical protein
MIFKQAPIHALSKMVIGRKAGRVAPRVLRAYMMVLFSGTRRRMKDSWLVAPFHARKVLVVILK